MINKDIIHIISQYLQCLQKNCNLYGHIKLIYYHSDKDKYYCTKCFYNLMNNTTYE